MMQVHVDSDLTCIACHNSFSFVEYKHISLMVVIMHHYKPDHIWYSLGIPIQKDSVSVLF